MSEAGENTVNLAREEWGKIELGSGRSNGCVYYIGVSSTGLMIYLTEL